jgi:aspartyl-tRNA synthetase
LPASKIDPLGEWRRTHYSKDITPSNDGKEVTVFGWISSIRDQGGLVFIIINDNFGIMQMTLHKNKVSKELLSKIESLSEHASIGVRGKVKTMSKAPNGAEIVPSEIKVLALAQKVPPFGLHAETLPSMDKRFEIRAVDLRRPKALAIFTIRGKSLEIIREFLKERGYHEVNTPKIIATATEGGAALFPLLYYDKEAFLTQSPQLFKEQLVMAFEKVFEIAPAYRAEQSRTLQHLSEFLSIDVEEAFVDYKDVMDTIEALISKLRAGVSKECSKELKMLGIGKLSPIEKIPRLTYDSIIELLKGKDVQIEWGDDLSSESLDMIADELPSYYFITDWPTKSKPFYIKPAPSPKLSESFDLMHGSLEIASGGTRIGSKKELMKRLKVKGLKPKSFEYHLAVFDYGMPPHAGFGLGFERLLMVLTGQKNIREVSVFPRDQFRLTP